MSVQPAEMGCTAESSPRVGLREGAKAEMSRNSTQACVRGGQVERPWNFCDLVLPKRDY